ncbi:MAG: hypothetical protein RR929_03760 [Erysipelotrichaceae bacterium]
MKKLTKTISTLLLSTLFIGSSLMMGMDSSKATNFSQTLDPNNLVWEKATDNNPLGGAVNFNGVIFGDFKGFVDTEGPLASSGTVDASRGISSTKPGDTYLSHNGWVTPDAIDDGKAKDNKVGLLLGDGKAYTKTFVEYGKIVLGSKSTYAKDPSNSRIIKTNAADKYMADAKADLIASNAKVYAKKANGIIFDEKSKEYTSDYPNEGRTFGAMVFKGTDAKLNIFELDYSLFPKMNDSMIIFDVPEDSGLIINVKDSSNKTIIMYGGNNAFYQGSTAKELPLIRKGKTFVTPTAEFAGRVLWNVNPSVDKINFLPNGSNYLLGSVLCPNADVNPLTGSSSVNGVLVAKSSTGGPGSGGAELHCFMFRGVDASGSTNPVVPPKPVDPNNPTNPVVPPKPADPATPVTPVKPNPKPNVPSDPNNNSNNNNSNNNNSNNSNNSNNTNSNTSSNNNSSNSNTSSDIVVDGAKPKADQDIDASKTGIVQHKGLYASIATISLVGMIVVMKKKVKE